jgi:hypothetical protein
MNETLILGEQTKEGLTHHESGYIAGSCIWCDQPVWASKEGFSSTDPSDTIDSTDEKYKNKKLMHKICLLHLWQTGNQVFEGLLKRFKVSQQN